MAAYLGMVFHNLTGIIIGWCLCKVFGNQQKDKCEEK